LTSTCISGAVAVAVARGIFGAAGAPVVACASLSPCISTIIPIASIPAAPAVACVSAVAGTSVRASVPLAAAVSVISIPTIAVPGFGGSCTPEEGKFNTLPNLKLDSGRAGNGST
jgi:hypothetical protein